MIFVPKFDQSGCLRKKMSRGVLLILLAVSAFPSTGIALPARLVLALDGIAYRDLKALQEGITCTNFWGRRFHRQAFSSDEGYFPVSRMISTFPSASDVAWTEIFGDRPLPGYQRTYFSTAANSEISINGVTTTMEHERQMHWQVENGFIRAMGYLCPVHTFEYELHELVRNFFNAKGDGVNYYAYMRSTDDAQHMKRDIIAMLGMLDQRLQELRVRYKAQEGRDLQIVILSDHGHNHAGRGQRVEVRAFLEKAGYRIAKSIVSPKDVVLPTVGIESWVEIHNSPAETEKLAQLLCQMKGVDVLTAPVPDQTNRFLVMNSKGERAVIQWNPAKNSFRYSTEQGDPINYRPVVEALARNNQFDADGFATADAWMAATMTNHYPLALERIVRGHTRVTLNPATILISLDNHYVNAGWLVEKGSRLVTCGSTHGGLDDLNSDGILLSNFTPTQDTSSGRVAGQFDDFPGLNNYRAAENGAEWVTRKEQASTRIERVPFDRDCMTLPDGEVFLRIWSPQFARLDLKAPVEVAIEKIPRFSSAPIQRGNHQPVEAFKQHITFNLPLSFPDKSAGERVYALPQELILEPHAEYKISGWIQDQKKIIRLFAFNFHTNSDGRSAAY
jgi:Type I phosphodiesterase / nucleotide pyrophosphatase